MLMLILIIIVNYIIRPYQHTNMSISITSSAHPQYDTIPYCIDRYQDASSTKAPSSPYPTRHFPQVPSSHRSQDCPKPPLLPPFPRPLSVPHSHKNKKSFKLSLNSPQNRIKTLCICHLHLFSILTSPLRWFGFLRLLSPCFLPIIIIALF